MSAGVLARLDRMENELRELHSELRTIRATVLAGDAPTMVVEQVSAEPPPLRIAAPTPPSARPPAPPRMEREPAQWERSVKLPRLELPKLDAADLFGARGLALAGGIVTLLGVVFFFVLAANNGWIGPLARVVLGGSASALVFAAGVVLHARHGRLHAAVAAAGAGIAGGYATLLAAAALYDLVPSRAALALAAAIAGTGVALSLGGRCRARIDRRDGRARDRHPRRKSHRHGNRVRRDRLRGSCRRRPREGMAKSLCLGGRRQRTPDPRARSGRRRPEALERRRARARLRRALLRSRHRPPARHCPSAARFAREHLGRRCSAPRRGLVVCAARG